MSDYQTIEKEIQPAGDEVRIPILPVEFHGSAREYFRIWIVNLCLTILSLGIFSAWAKVRKKRFAYAHTTIEGTPFQYLAKPIPILKGRIIAAVGFGAYYITSHFVTSLFPFVLVAGLIFAPWVLVRSMAFKARYSAFRNMTFHFDANYMDGAKAFYAYGMIPLSAIGLIPGLIGKIPMLVIISIIPGLLFPFWLCRLKKFAVENTDFGGIKGRFFVSGGQYFKIYFLAGLILMGLMVPVFILFGVVGAFTKKISVMTYTIPIITYTGYALSFAYIKARSHNLVWNNTRLGPLRFESTYQWGELIKLYTTNALGIVASLGLLIPWAVIRTWKYRADNMKVINTGTLAEFHGKDMTAVSASGAETLDFFDLDLSL